MKKHFYILLISIFAITSAQAQEKKILDKTWILTQLGNEEISFNIDKTPYIKLTEGRVGGFSACNRLMGSYTLNGETLVFNEIGGTLMFCQDVHELESKFMQTLQKTNYWKCKGGKLSFFDKDKVLIMKFKIKK
jgi:heat shock protein HslJ